MRECRVQRSNSFVSTTLTKGQALHVVDLSSRQEGCACPFNRDRNLPILSISSGAIRPFASILKSEFQEFDNVALKQSNYRVDMVNTVNEHDGIQSLLQVRFFSVAQIAKELSCR
jgi:hypothetical protein